jgi:hypothetical protein
MCFCGKVAQILFGICAKSEIEHVAAELATISEWNNYYSESSPEIAKAIQEYESNVA